MSESGIARMCSPCYRGPGFTHPKGFGQSEICCVGRFRYLVVGIAWCGRCWKRGESWGVREEGGGGQMGLEDTCNVDVGLS